MWLKGNRQPSLLPICSPSLCFGSLKSVICLLIGIVLALYASALIHYWARKPQIPVEKPRASLETVASRKEVGSLASLDQASLIDHIRKEWIHPPSRLAYNVKTPPNKDASQVGQALYVLKLLRGLKGGFFIECGAADGEIFSNSLYLERVMKWNGLLIEANPETYPVLLKKNRKAYTVNACLYHKPGKVRFRLAGVKGLLGGVPSAFQTGHLGYLRYVQQRRETTTQCFTLHSLLSAVNTTRVDYFSLDVEGAEINVLKTIPLKKIHITLFGIEYRAINSYMKVDMIQTMKNLDNLRNFFANTGLYKEVGILPPRTKNQTRKQEERSGLDVFFMRNV